MASLSSHRASYWKPLGGGKVQCLLCPNRCIIPPGGRGICKVRYNDRGVLRLLTYGKPCVVKPEPIEKQPFLHFLPGSSCLALGTAGCNLGCLYCQNWYFAQEFPEKVRAYDLPPRTVVSLAKRWKCKVISFTFNDPAVILEYVMDTAKLAKKHGIRTVMVTGGYLNLKPLRDACKVVDAIKVDFKGFDEGFYRSVVKGHLKPVLDVMKTIRKEGVWLEIVNLVIPRRNDNPRQVTELCKWVRDELGSFTPLTFSRFWPKYKLRNLPQTPISTLEKCREIGYKVGLKFVYIGNTSGHPGESTYCPRCKKKIIKRVGFSVRFVRLKNGKCAYCGYPIPGVWS